MDNSVTGRTEADIKDTLSSLVEAMLNVILDD